MNGNFLNKWLITALAAFGLLACALSVHAHADEAMPSGSNLTIEAVRIEVVDDHPNGFDWAGFARVFIGMAPGDRFSAEAMDLAVTALADFSDVQSSVHTGPAGVTLTFILKPYKRIKSIDFSGLFPLFERDIQNVMTLSTGDLFRPETVQAQSDLIAARYLAEGYIEPKVHLSWVQDPGDGHYHIDVAVDKGAYFVLKDIDIQGARAYPVPLLKGLMASWRRATAFLGTDRFLETRLKEDMVHLVTFYRSHGYADVKIGYAPGRDSANRVVTVVVTIDEGPHYSIVYSGNRFFTAAVLNRDLVLFEKGNRGNTGIRRSVQNIRRRYRQAGFADVRVLRKEAAENKDSLGQRLYRIEIDEGRRYIVQEIDIQGNRAINTEDILGQMLTQPAKTLKSGAYAQALLQEDMAAILSLYRQKGFLNVNVKDNVSVDPETKAVTITLTVEEGVETRVGSIHWEGDAPLPRSQLMAQLQYKPGEPYQPQGLQLDENALAARIAPLGYPHVQVKGRVVFSRDQARADIFYAVDTGPFVRLGAVFIFGHFRTRDAIMRRAMALEPGSPFSLIGVINAQNRLRDLDLFKSVQVRSLGLKERSPVVHLLVTLVEKPAYFFESGGGYQTDKGAYVRIKSGDRNFMGSGDKIWVGGEISDIGYRWDAGISDPSILGSRVRADLSLFTERRDEFNQDFGTETVGGKLTFFRPLNRLITTALGVRYERRQQYLLEQDTSASLTTAEALEPRTLVVITPAVRYDSRDSFIRPRRGGLVSLSADISYGLESTLDNFIKYRSDLRYFYTPKDRLTFALRGFAGYILPYGVDGEIPEDQLFFLGGTADVRGFEENMLRFDGDMNPEGGKLALSGSVEARYDMGGNWEVTVFVDAGSLSDLTSNEQDGRWRWTAGMGLRYITPIGPIGLLYGHKIDPLADENAGQFHFSIGYTF